MFIDSEVLLELDGMGFSGDEDGNSDMSSSSSMGRTSARRRASAVRTSFVKTSYLPVTTVSLAESAPTDWNQIGPTLPARTPSSIDGHRLMTEGLHGGGEKRLWVSEWIQEPVGRLRRVETWQAISPLMAVMGCHGPTVPGADTSPMERHTRQHDRDCESHERSHFIIQPRSFIVLSF